MITDVPLVLLTGMPGSGKDTAEDGLFHEGGILPQQRYNTRHPRGGELNGRWTRFISNEVFLLLDSQGRILKWTIRKTPTPFGDYRRGIPVYADWNPFLPDTKAEVLVCGPRTALKINRPGRRIVRIFLTAKNRTLFARIADRYGRDFVKDHMDKIWEYRKLGIEARFPEKNVVHTDNMTPVEVLERVKEIIFPPAQDRHENNNQHPLRPWV